MSWPSRLMIGAGLGALALATALHAALVFGAPQVWPALIHVLLFGWITGLIYGVNFHTLPLFTGRDFPWPSLQVAQWALWLSGLVAVVVGYLWRQPTLRGAGLILELAASVVFMANVFGLLRKGPERGWRMPNTPAQKLIDRQGTRATSLAGLCLTIALSLLVSVHFQAIPATWFLAGEHVVTLGWLMLMIVGVAWHVLPRWAGAPLALGLVTWALRLHTLALPVLVLGVGLDVTWLFAAGATLMTSALALFVASIRPCLFSPRLNPLTRRCVVAALGYLSLGIGLGVSFAFDRAIGAKYFMLHAEFNLWGFATLLIFGMAYHMLPRFSGHGLRWPKVATIQTWVAIAGVAITSLGWLLSLRWLTQLGMGVQIAAIATFAVLIAGTLRGVPQRKTSHIELKA